MRSHRLRCRYCILTVVIGCLCLLRADESDWEWTVGNWPEGNAWGEGCYFAGEYNPFLDPPPPVCEPGTAMYWEPELWEKHWQEQARLQVAAEEEKDQGSHEEEPRAALY